MISTSGSVLLPQEAIRELREDLLPQTTILTPNVPEAKLLLSDARISANDPEGVDDLIKIAKAVQNLGPRYVLLKGGHLPLKKDGSVAKTDEEKEIMVDILYGDEKVTRIETAYLTSKNTHGTGCSLACKYVAPRMWPLSNTSSCHCIKPCKRPWDSGSSKTCLQIRGSWHKDLD